MSDTGKTLGDPVAVRHGLRDPAAIGAALGLPTTEDYPICADVRRESLTECSILAPTVILTEGSTASPALPFCPKPPELPNEPPSPLFSTAFGN